MYQLASLLGALAILGAFAAQQFEWLATDTLAYQLLNLVGAGLLNLVAIHDGRYGFILLESAWMLISLWGLYTLRRARQSAPAGGEETFQ